MCLNMCVHCPRSHALVSTIFIYIIYTLLLLQWTTKMGLTPLKRICAAAHVERNHTLDRRLRRVTETRSALFHLLALNDTPTHERAAQGRRRPDAPSAKQQACELDVHALF